VISRPAFESKNWLQILYGLFGIAVGIGAGILVVGIPDALRLFVIVIGIIAFTASITRLEWGLLVLVFITYTRFSDIAIQFHGAPSTAKSFIALLLIAIFVRWIVYEEKPEGWQQAFFVVGAYSLVAFASVLYAANPERAQGALSNLLKNGVIVLIVVILLHRVSLYRQVIWTLLITGIFMGTLSVIQYLTGSFGNNFAGFAQAPVMNIVGDTSGRRVAGPIGDPNFYAQIMLVLIPIALDRLWNEDNRFLRLLALWALTASGLAVVFSFSRGGFLAMLAALGAMGILHPPKPRAVLITMVVLVILFPFIPSTYTERIMTISEFLPGSAPQNVPPGEASYRGRISELMVGLMMFRDHPVLGVGYDNYPVHYQEYSRQLGLDPRTEQRSAHNLYIEVAAETGLLGILTFMMLLFVTLRGVWRSWRALYEAGMKKSADMVAAFGVGFLGYLAAGMFVHDAYPRYFWLLVGIGLALQNVVKYELDKSVR
jgi:O-antigen ligase